MNTCSKILLLLVILVAAANTYSASPSTEEIIKCENSADAIRKALFKIGTARLDQVNDIMIGTMQDAENQVVGIQYQDHTAKSFQLRADYDPSKGCHINVTLGHGRGRKKLAFIYPSVFECAPETGFQDQLSSINKFAADFADVAFKTAGYGQVVDTETLTDEKRLFAARKLIEYFRSVAEAA